MLTTVTSAPDSQTQHRRLRRFSYSAEVRSRAHTEGNISICSVIFNCPPARSLASLLILGSCELPLGSVPTHPGRSMGRMTDFHPQPQFCVLVMHVTPIVKGDHVLYEPCLYLSWAVQTNRETWKHTRADG